MIELIFAVNDKAVGAAPAGAEGDEAAAAGTGHGLVVYIFCLYLRFVSFW